MSQKNCNGMRCGKLETFFKNLNNFKLPETSDDQSLPAREHSALGFEAGCPELDGSCEGLESLNANVAVMHNLAQFA